MQNKTRVYRYFFLIGFLLTFLIIPFHLEMVSDSKSRWKETRWMLTGEDPGGQLPGRNGSMHFDFGPGHSFMMLPPDWLVLKARPLFEDTYWYQRNSDQIEFLAVSILIFPVINGLFLLLSFLLLRILGLNCGEAMWGCLSLVFSSTALWYFQNNQENTAQYLWTVTSLFSIIKWTKTKKDRWLWLGFFCLGFNMLIRITTVVNFAFMAAFPIVHAFLVKRDQHVTGMHFPVRKYVLKCLFIGGPIFLFFIGLDRFWHWLRFGHADGNYIDVWTSTMRVQYPWLSSNFPFDAPFLEGFLGPLFSPGKSIFLYNPLFFMVIGLALFCWKKMGVTWQAYFITCLGLMLILLAGHAKFFMWGGNESWGTRYSTVPSHMLILVAIPLTMKIFSIKNPLKHKFLSLFLGFVFFLQVASLVLPCWVEAHQLKSEGTIVNARPEHGRPAFPFNVNNAFFMGKRFKNIADQIFINQDKSQTQSQTPLWMLLPMAKLETIPHKLSLMIKALWWGLFFALLRLLFVTAKKCTDADKTYEEEV